MDVIAPIIGCAFMFVGVVVPVDPGTVMEAVMIGLVVSALIAIAYSFIRWRALSLIGRVLAVLSALLLALAIGAPAL